MRRPELDPLLTLSDVENGFKFRCFTKHFTVVVVFNGYKLMPLSGQFENNLQFTFSSSPLQYVFVVMIWFNRTSLFCLVNQLAESASHDVMSPPHILREFPVLFLLAASSNGLVSMLSCYPCVMLRKQPSPLSQPSPQKSQATCYPKRRDKRAADRLPLGSLCLPSLLPPSGRIQANASVRRTGFNTTWPSREQPECSSSN